MGDFLYRALDEKGQMVEASIAADNEQEVISRLKAQKLSPLSIKEKSAPKQRQSFIKRHLSRRDITNFTNQLASLLNAKLPLTRSLKAIENQATNPELQKLAAHLCQMVGEGKPLSDALNEYPGHFSGLYISIVRAGEVGGFLEKALSRIAEMLERDEALKSRLKGALTYPAIMFFVMIISVIVLLTFVVPRFTGMFAEMGGALPLPTKMLLGISSFFKHCWWALFLVMGGGGLGFWYYAKTEDGALQIDKMKLNLPLAGALIKEVGISRLSLTLGSLLESGVNMLQALDAAKDVAGNKHFSNIVLRIQKDVREGISLSQAMNKHPDIFPPLVTGMVGTGEEAGNLDEMLKNVGKYYMQQSDAKIKTLTTLLEPVIILVMGLMVGFIIVAMLLPIFEMTTMIR